jgi:hypothetical protein
MVAVHESNFRLLAGQESLTEYRFNSYTARHFFCSVCGIYTFHRRRSAPDTYCVNVFLLDDFDLEGIPIRSSDGAQRP